MRKFLSRIFSSIAATSFALCSTTTMLASAAEYEADMRRVAEIKSRLWAECIEKLAENGVNVSSDANNRDTYYVRPLNDYTFNCLIPSDVSSPSGNVGLYGINTSDLTGRDAKFTEGRISSSSVIANNVLNNFFNFQATLTNPTESSFPVAFSIRFTVTTGMGLSSNMSFMDCIMSFNYISNSSCSYSYCELGDVNHDGSISYNDADKIIDHVAYNMAHLDDPNWTYADFVYGDVNCDGVVNANDAYHVLLYVSSNTCPSIYSTYS